MYNTRIMRFILQCTDIRLSVHMASQNRMTERHKRMTEYTAFQDSLNITNAFHLQQLLELSLLRMSLHSSTLSPVSPLPVVTSFFNSSAFSTTTPILLLFS
jgi:hypothetical protein